MRIIIIEDEFFAVERLKQMILSIRPSTKILATIDSVEETVQWLQNNQTPDLIFMDIQLADGESFDIFQKIEVSAPVIFTTAYDQYTMEAFKSNGIDYLLKPVEEDELKRAIYKFENLKGLAQADQNHAISELLSRMSSKKEFKDRFLLKSGKEYVIAHVDDIAYFMAEEGVVFIWMKNGKRKIVDSTIEQIEHEMDPKKFFRVSRSTLVSIDAVQRIHAHFNSRLKLDLIPNPGIEIMVSRNRVKDFKKWLDH
jgi:DNA-binding LytR/AlgR family response regulator